MLKNISTCLYKFQCSWAYYLFLFKHFMHEAILLLIKPEWRIFTQYLALLESLTTIPFEALAEFKKT